MIRSLEPGRARRSAKKEKGHHPRSLSLVAQGRKVVSGEASAMFHESTELLSQALILITVAVLLYSFSFWKSAGASLRKLFLRSLTIGGEVIQHMIVYMIAEIMFRITLHPVIESSLNVMIG